MSSRLLNSYIAHESNRAYVFLPYTWSIGDEDFVPIEENTHLSSSKYTYNVRPSRIPLSAFIDSPTTGRSWPKGDSAPRSIAESYWEEVCPQEKQLHVNITAVNIELGFGSYESGAMAGAEIIQRWVKYLKELDHGCVNVLWDTPRMIDYE